MDCQRVVYIYYNLWQGFLLPPYLSILLSDVLSRTLRKEHNRSRLVGAVFGSMGASMTHIFFVDSYFIVMQIPYQMSKVLKHIFGRYSGASGLSINLSKFVVYFKEVDIKIQRKISNSSCSMSLKYIIVLIEGKGIPLSFFDSLITKI